MGQGQVLPQPFAMPARLPSLGQFGAQQLPLYSEVPLGQGQVPPQPFAMPALLPSLGQLAAQHSDW